ncbi:phytanoyl-CoA dioxygenase family protein [Massilia sp. ST3]|uniref:phytanoyl-CoA dioxygenase family protein n=1 Tax=Massilia sp. ST3 TaxID=2824903 RepID=UPI001B835C8A|nr:phytanoyl-CoA dioxygenase family protein [Massilia sp. ST3]MBQ5946008.1 phytanoyl-CoA dioxygenase family protein [Massilia sp. ST3]
MEASKTAGAGVPTVEQVDVSRIMGGLYGDGIIACRGAFERAWVERLGADIAMLFDEARGRPGGALERGPNRYYVEVHPERLSGFLDIVTHPWVVSVCRAVLGPDYKIVEVGFDVPGPGAMHQPWHRDFASPPETLVGRRLSSLAFNITTVDVTEDMGPFEIAPGTQWDDLTGGDPMFPPQGTWARYEERAQRKLPQAGDISARSALTIHRGTANRSNRSRPVLVVGAEAPDCTSLVKHDLQMSRAFHASLPLEVARHLNTRVVDQLEAIYQAHTIEGLRMGVSMS